MNGELHIVDMIEHRHWLMVIGEDNPDTRAKCLDIFGRTFEPKAGRAKTLAGIDK